MMALQAPQAHWSVIASGAMAATITMPLSETEMAWTERSSRGRTRTCDPLINSQLLYQLSYSGK